MNAPTTSAQFDRSYRSLFTPWGDIRIPPEISALVEERNPASALELGCGVGRVSRYLASKGLRVIGVDSLSCGDCKGRGPRGAG